MGRLRWPLLLATAFGLAAGLWAIGRAGWAQVLASAARAGPVVGYVRVTMLIASSSACGTSAGARGQSTCATRPCAARGSGGPYVSGPTTTGDVGGCIGSSSGSRPGTSLSEAGGPITGRPTTLCAPGSGALIDGPVGTGGVVPVCAAAPPAGISASTPVSMRV